MRLAASSGRRYASYKLAIQYIVVAVGVLNLYGPNISSVSDEEQMRGLQSTHNNQESCIALTIAVQPHV
jgi:hypothetical protein